jgi:hypothetical protein
MVNTVAARATFALSSNSSLPNVHCHSLELQGHLQVIGDDRTRRLHHRTPPPIGSSVCPLPQHLARRDALASLVPLPPPLLHLVGWGTNGGRAMADAPRMVTAVGVYQRASWAWGAFGQG